MVSSRLSKKFRKHKDTILFAVCLLFSLSLLVFSTPAGIGGIGKIGFSLVSVVQKGYYGAVGFFSGTVNSISELKKLKSTGFFTSFFVGGLVAGCLRDHSGRVGPKRCLTQRSKRRGPVRPDARPGDAGRGGEGVAPLHPVV